MSLKRVTRVLPFFLFYSFFSTGQTNLGQGESRGGFPTFDLHYHMPTDGTTVTLGNLWLYTTYETYRSILTHDASANTKSRLDVDDGIYYDGFDALDQKAQYVKDQGYGGLMMWIRLNHCSRKRIQN